MKKVILLISVLWFGFFDIGDNAPPLPSTFVTTHPRIGSACADTTYLAAVWAGRAGTYLRIFTAANAWDSANIPNSNSITVANYRYTIIAYCAANNAGAPGNATAATYLPKLRAMADLNGGWGILYDSGSDGVTTATGTEGGTLSSASMNFNTGCAGGSCLNKYIAIGGFTYQITLINSATSVNIGNTSQPVINIGISIRWSAISANPGLLGTFWGVALAYDWLYNMVDFGTSAAVLDSTMKAALLQALKGYSYQWQTAMCQGPAGPPGCNSTVKPGPFSDTSYTRIIVNGMVVALAEYEPTDVQSRTDLQYARDFWHNIFLSGWKHMWGNDYCAAENDAGTRTSNNAFQPGCGGSWHDGWQDYVASPSGNGQAPIFFTSLIAMANAYGQMSLRLCTFPDGSTQNLPDFFCTNSWIKNFAYWTMYKARPDFVEEENGSIHGTFGGEYGKIGATGTQPAPISLDGIAEVYDDPTTRSWARTLNRGFCTGDTVLCVPDGVDPSAWPYYPPDSSAKSVVSGLNARVNLGTTRLFQNWGLISMRTGWGEDDTTLTLKYAGNKWSHPEMDAGTINIYSRGAVLLGYSGCNYQAGSDSDCVQNYKIQTIAHSTMRLYDPNDIYTAEGSVISLGRNDGTHTFAPFPNDGGQRRIGSSVSNRANGMQVATGQPATMAQYQRNREYYNTGDLLGYQVGPSSSYTYAMVDITAAYNNHWSAVPYNSGSLWDCCTANSSNRSLRAQNITRAITFIPSKTSAGAGTAAYIVDFFHVIATNASFVKSNLYHFINDPTIVGNHITATRAELATGYPGLGFMSQFNALLTHKPNSTQYQYGGKIDIWCMLPSGCVMTKIGGPGREFETTDTSNGGQPFNHNECTVSSGNPDSPQCGTPFGSVVGMNREPFNITGSNNGLSITVDGGSTQTVTLTTGAARTATQIIAEINAAITGVTATVEGVNPQATTNTQGRVAITSNTSGGASAIRINASTATSVLGYTNYVGKSITVATDQGMMIPQGASNVKVQGVVRPFAAATPVEMGSWRVEQTELPVNATVTAYTSGTPNKETWFLNLQRATSTTDTVTITSGPTVTPRLAGVAACPSGGADCFELTWTDSDGSNTCVHTWTGAKRGAGATLVVAGARCKATI